MEARKPNIIGAETDAEFDTFESPTTNHPPHRPIQFRHASVEADHAHGEGDEGESVLRPKPQRPKKIQPLSLTNANNHRRTDTPTNGAHSPQPLGPTTAPPPPSSNEALLNDSFVETARQLRQLSADLLLSAAAMAASLAELAANVITLLGRTVLLFPGQFIHTSWLSLFQRLSGQEPHYEEAFARNWKVYRNLLVARHQIGPYELTFSFVVGLSLMLPLLLLKFLELLNALIRLFRP